MQTPPPFHGYEGQMAPKKPKTNGVVILFAVLGVLLICCGLPIGFLGYFGFKGFKGAMEMTGCYVNVETMKKALHSYENDHDGKLPNAKTWQTDLAKYMTVDKDMEGAPMKIWKSGGEWSCEEGDVKTGFTFNEALSEKKAVDVIKQDPKAIAIFESKSIAFNQSGPIETIPKDQSPKMIGGLMNEHRGWMLVSAEGEHVYTWDNNGKVVIFTMGSNSKHKNGVNIDFSSNTTSDDSKDSKGAKEDNSN